VCFLLGITQTLLQGTTTNSDGSTSPLSLVYTTSPAANSLFGGSVRQALLQSTPSFDNSDGRPDAWSVSAALPLQDSESITSVQMATFFDFTTHVRTSLRAQAPPMHDLQQIHTQDVARVKMNGMLAMTASSPVAGSAATVYGTVALRQASRVPAAQGFLLADGDTQLVDLDNVASSSDISLSALMRAYSSRNCTSAPCMPSALICSNAVYVQTRWCWTRLAQRCGRRMAAPLCRGPKPSTRE